MAALFGLELFDGSSRIALPYNSDADAAYDFLVLLFDFDLCCKMLRAYCTRDAVFATYMDAVWSLMIFMDICGALDAIYLILGWFW